VVQDTVVTEGEHDAVERVWIEHGPRLWRSLLAFIADVDVASDAMAEASAVRLGALVEPFRHAEEATFDQIGRSSRGDQ
jgi:hypothetical protein